MRKVILQIGVVALGVFLILGSGSNSDSGVTTLNTPTNFNATPAYKSAVTTWNAVTSADSYDVCYATESITNINNCTSYAGGTLKTVSNNAAAISTLTAGQLYYFRVIAKTSSGVKSDASAQASVIPTLGLNDTGISGCGSGIANNLSCPIIGYPNQDAQKGLDASATDSVNGVAGFDFTKLDSNGAVLGASANTWSCVRDNITGLVWEAKTSFNKDKTFAWYSTDANTNAGASGNENSGGDTCTGYDVNDSTSYCNTKAYAERVNFGSHCGLSNWRLPMRHELNSIINYDVVSPSIDLAYFTHTQSALYWSATPSFSSPTSDFVWASNFNYGGSAKHNKQDSLHVRLVSGGQ